MMLANLQMFALDMVPHDVIMLPQVVDVRL